MKQTWYARLAFCALLAALTACSRGADNGAAGTVKLNINGQPVINHLYIEVNDTDPRVALGYIMEKSKKPFFDHVVLFAANLRDRDCAAEKQQGGGADHDCYKSGVHLHFNGNVQHILDNRAVYIKPLQDKGVKVQLGLLADWGGVTFGTLGGWPLGPRDDAYPYALNNTLDDNAQLNTTETAGAAYAKQNGYKESRWEGGYPYTETVRDAFLNEVKAALDKYELDGIDLDDEYGSKSIYAGEYVYPKTSGTQWYDGQPRPVYHYYGNNKGKTAAALADGGKIMAKVAISAREILGPDKLITFYEYDYGNGEFGGELVWKGKTVQLADYVDFTGEAEYGNWVGSSAIFAPNRQYAPVAIDLGGPSAEWAIPPLIDGPADITMRMKHHVRVGYGANLFYCLLSRGRYDGSIAHNLNGDSLPDRTGYFDTAANRHQKNMPEVYLSKVAQLVYGENVIYEGPDYPQDWAKR